MLKKIEADREISRLNYKAEKAKLRAKKLACKKREPVRLEEVF